MSVPAAIARRPSASQRPAYLDPSLPIDRRVDDLVSRMTIEEKASQLTNSAAAIPRLGGRPTADRPGFFAEVTIEGEKQLSD